MNLDGKVALVTGAGRGIGHAIARSLCEAGATVYLASRNEAELEKARTECDPQGTGRARTLRMDVSDSHSVAAAGQRLAQDGGRLDILVNSAGVNLRGAVGTYSEENWDTVIDTNLKGVFLTARMAYPMLKKRGGKVINIASLMSEIARPTIAAYVASKGGVRQLTKALAVEWAPDNIQVNAIAPGFIATEMNLPLTRDEAFNAMVIGRTPARRWGTPEDISGTALFLVSPAADFLTGQIITVDGGLLASL